MNGAANTRRGNWLGIAAGVAGASAVLLGAAGAHALRGMLSATMLDVWQTAVRFQFWHALALVVCALFARRSRAARVAGCLFVCGIVLFCGSLYALALGAPHWAGAITPFGGIAFVAGWVALGAALYRHST